VTGGSSLVVAPASHNGDTGIGAAVAEPVEHLRCSRGIDTLSAATIAAEVCDFRRFRNAASFMAFTGLLPWSTYEGLLAGVGHFPSRNGGQIHQPPGRPGVLRYER
jgi:hypothetical protein